MSKANINVGVIFGGVSPEHEVSVISSLQAFHALQGRDEYHPVPVYIAKDGAWYAGEPLADIEAYRDLDALRDRATRVRLEPATGATLMLVEAERSGFLGSGLLGDAPKQWSIDVVLPGLHGGAGENGGMQGLCEMMGVPYAGSGVYGSALGMDKVRSKLVCRQQGLPVVDFRWLREADWAGHEEEWLGRLEEALGYPVVVKPARLGSSIGIAHADDRPALDAAIEEALRYDEKIIIERAVEALREINCSVLGDPAEAEASVLEEPMAAGAEAVLTFRDKYTRADAPRPEVRAKASPQPAGTKGEAPGGMAAQERIIPADLSDERTRALQELAVRVFQLFECAGVARIDFMIDEATDEVYFNEINTLPGSFSFYLWEPSGVPFDELLHRMVAGGRRRHRARRGRVQTYDVNLLAEGRLEGLKEAK